MFRCIDRLIRLYKHIARLVAQQNILLLFKREIIRLGFDDQGGVLLDVLFADEIHVVRVDLKADNLWPICSAKK